MKQGSFNCRLLLSFILGCKLMICNAAGITSLAVSVASDSIKQKYSVADALNPDCPCYKYQRKAEREYKRVLQEETQQQKQLEKHKLNAVKEYPHIDRKKGIYVRKRRHGKTPSFNTSRRREKKGFLNFFRKSIVACAF